jgi:hypothetical protein
MTKDWSWWVVSRLVLPWFHGRYHKHTLKCGWLAVIMLTWNLGKNGVSGMKEAPKWVWLDTRQSVWIDERLILMSCVKISPLVSWEAGGKQTSSFKLQAYWWNLLNSWFHRMHHSHTLNCGWLAVIMLAWNLGKNGVSGMKEAPKWVSLDIRQSVRNDERLILMSCVKISPPLVSCEALY